MPRWIEVGAYLVRQPLSVAVVAAVTCTLLWQLQPDDSHDEASLVTRAAQVVDRDHLLGLRHELTQVQVQNAALLRQIQTLQQQVDALPVTFQAVDVGEPAVVADEAPQQMQLAEQEIKLAAQAGLRQDDFTQLEEQFYAESADAEWAGTMQRDMNLVEARLSQLDDAGTSIRYYECRSSTCRVEFLHEDAAPSLLPALIAAPNSSRISTRTARTDEGEITVALYRR